VPRYYLGVDGGGTNCRVRLADENLNTLAEVRNGRSNLQIDDGEPAYQAISMGTKEVFAQAGLDAAQMANTYACFGMAGARLISARDEFAARPWPFAAVKVYDDIDIAHAGALGGGDGAVIIVGTGSAGLAIVGGKRFQVGGWGFPIGDQMSGAILGRELVRITVEAEDGLVPGSALTKAVAAQMGDNDAIMDWSFKDERNPADYGALMPMFIDYFEKGDPIARQLMDLQLSYIDNYANWFKARDAKVMAIVGGFGQRLFPLLQQRYGDFVALPLYEPLHGAVILAKQNFA
jgi:glucosamine kinase